MNIEYITSVKEQWDNIQDKNVVSYKVNNSMSVPIAKGNKHYQDVLEWLKENEAEPQFAEEEITTKINLSKFKELEQAIFNYLNNQCKVLGFTGDDTTKPFRAIANYVGYDNEFRTDAEKLGNWISKVFKVTEAIEADVKDGSREIPTVSEFLDELPTYEDE